MDNRFPRINPTTKNLADEKFRWLAEHFPEAVTESYDGEGRLVRAIDKEKLMQDIAHYVVDGPKERYQFTWPGKKEAILTANAPIARALRPCKEESVDFDKTGNLYIEGDNLDVLKSLREVYLGKVKMIYIDPPYNTGNDMVYEDDFAQSMEDYKEIDGERDENENRLFPNTESNGRFHTDWLNMIYPRLKIARDFLADDGVIFISIDDSEVGNLRKICDEIFGSNNFICEFIWKSKLGKVGTTSIIATTHEYILCYAKDATSAKFKMIRNESEGRKENLRQWGVADRRVDRPSMWYPIKIDGIEVYPIKNDGTEGRWRVGREMAMQLLSSGVLKLENKKGHYNIYRIFPANISYAPYDTLLDEIGTTAKGAVLLKSLDMEKIFEFSKPVELIRHFSFLSTSASDIVLDFFSGSATTAHATMQLNAEDGGQRKFIMVQLPEVCEQDSEAYKAGYKTICDIGKERIRRAGKKIRDDLQSSIDSAKAKLTKLEEDQKKNPELFGGGQNFVRNHGRAPGGDSGENRAPRVA